jgi:predicted  nucleic acid-binding Zn-ribbon protein
VSLSERLLKYAETVITLSKVLEATEEKIAEVRAEVSQLRTLFQRANERIAGLEKDIEYLKRELAHLALTEFLREAKRKEILKLRGQVKWEADLEELRCSRL